MTLIPEIPAGIEDLDAHWHQPTIQDCDTDDYGELEPYARKWSGIGRIAFILGAASMLWALIIGGGVAACRGWR